MRENWHWLALAAIVIAGLVYWQKRKAATAPQAG